MREAVIERHTKETQIDAELRIEGIGSYEISTGIRFLDHMLELFAKHGGFDLKFRVAGDLDVDQHHTVEDAGIVLGDLFSKALGDRRGINRAGYFVQTMDESLAVVAVDLGGRPALVYDQQVDVVHVGDLQTELLEDFFDGFANHAAANIHVKIMYGRSSHHKIEAIFKCFARAMRYACSTDERFEGSTAFHEGSAVTTIVDYGAGNLRSVQNTLEELGAPYEVTNSAVTVERATKIILPGVGHFGQMLTAIDQLALREPLIAMLKVGVPFLGICIGLQCLFEESEEAPGIKGLGIFPGTVKRFTGNERIPHMGWNSLDRVKPSELLKGLDANAYTYFAHSYYAPVNHATAATCHYMQPYSAVLELDNIHAVQFHPEKSGPVGLKVMSNFVGL